MNGAHRGDDKLPRFNYLINGCNKIVAAATIITWLLLDCDRRCLDGRWVDWAVGDAVKLMEIDEIRFVENI